MPNDFRPRLKSNPELGVKEQFLAIDIKLCEMLGVEVDSTNWVNHWVDTIGFCFAIGETADKIIESYRKPGYEMNEQEKLFATQQIAIVNWLVENCDIDCYYQP